MEKGSSAYNGSEKGRRRPEEEKASEAELRPLLGLEAEWSVWEQWQPMKKQRDEDYMKNMQIVAEFNNLLDFCQAWNYLPHADPSNYFSCRDSTDKQVAHKQYSFIFLLLESRPILVGYA